MKKLVVLFLLLPCFAAGQDSLLTIKVHFLYGSKPAKGHRKTETRWFGGMHGGHVTLQMGDSVIGFNPFFKYHIFPHKKKKSSAWVLQTHDEFVRDTFKHKYTSVEIPVTEAQYLQLKMTANGYLEKTPYDYAFLGMRCAAATYDLLGQIGVVKEYSKFRNVFSNFYPKLLRKKIFNLTLENNYKITFHNGTHTRKWEKDKRRYRKKLKLE